MNLEARLVDSIHGSRLRGGGFAQDSLRSLGTSGDAADRIGTTPGVYTESRVESAVVACISIHVHIFVHRRGCGCSAQRYHRRCIPVVGDEILVAFRLFEEHVRSFAT